MKRWILHGINPKLLINRSDASGVKAYDAGADILDAVDVRDEKVKKRGIAPTELLGCYVREARKQAIACIMAARPSFYSHQSQVAEVALMFQEIPNYSKVSKAK